MATGFDRPNIAFGVARPAPHEKRALIAECLRGEDALPAIVYTGTRAGAEEAASELTEALGEPAVAYHAGIERERRADVQRRFLADDVRVICATNAFGMGVDKPNVRTVVHATVPSSLEAYYQEAGRAGRDGAPARALLLAENRDKALHVHFIKRDEIDADLPAWLADRLAAAADGNGRFDLEAAGLARDLKGDGDRLGRSSATSLAPASSRPRRRPRTGSPAGCSGASTAGPRPSAAPRSRRAARTRWRQYREIWAYVEQEACRRQALLGHFGDTVDPDRSRRPLLRRLRARARAGAAAARSRAARTTWTMRSCRWPPAPVPPSAARSARRSSTARARRRSSATPTTGCPPTACPRTCAGPTSSRAWTT